MLSVNYSDNSKPQIKVGLYDAKKSSGSPLGLQVCLFTICILDKSEVKYFINGMFRSILNHPAVSAA